MLILKKQISFVTHKDQRRKETKKKKYSKIQLELKKEKIQGKTIIEWETELSKLNRKSLNITKFKEYIQKKSEINVHQFNQFGRLKKYKYWYSFMECTKSTCALTMNPVSLAILTMALWCGMSYL